MQVKDLMSSHLITVDREETVAAAAVWCGRVVASGGAAVVIRHAKLP